MNAPVVVAVVVLAVCLVAIAVIFWRHVTEVRERAVATEEAWEKGRKLLRRD